MQQTVTVKAYLYNVSLTALEAAGETLMMAARPRARSSAPSKRSTSSAVRPTASAKSPYSSNRAIPAERSLTSAVPACKPSTKSCPGFERALAVGEGRDDPADLSTGGQAPGLSLNAVCAPIVAEILYAFWLSIRCFETTRGRQLERSGADGYSYRPCRKSQRSGGSSSTPSPVTMHLTVDSREG